jgi:hypothetical protein
MPSNAIKERRKERKESFLKLQRKNKPDKRRKMKGWKMKQTKKRL